MISLKHVLFYCIIFINTVLSIQAGNLTAFTQLQMYVKYVTHAEMSEMHKPAKDKYSSDAMESKSE